jgi:catechol 2,3-dioxygenase-like lactoylglutathione lyase family enzyme
VRVSVVLDCLDPDALVAFWSSALNYRAVSSPAGYRVLVADEDGTAAPVLILQRVPETRQGKNRMHLDIHAPPDLGVPGLVDRLEALDGRRLGGPVTDLLESAGVWWQVMADPEGNEFCVVADPGHPPPG